MGFVLQHRAVSEVWRELLVMACFILLVLVLLLLSPQQSHSRRTYCKPITSSFCQGVGYNTTTQPTGATGFNLKEVGQIVETACSPLVDTLMCRAALPECGADYDYEKRPCRSLCERVKSDCDPVISTKGLVWPVKLRCELLPTINCVEGPVGYVPPPSCEPITTPLCSDLGYTQALIPNFLGHTNQRRAREELNIFSSLVRVGCSRQLKPFICSVYVPECEAAQAEPPCRTLCEQARTGCEPLMNKFGVQWPQSLSCENFTTESCQNAFSERHLSKCETITVPICKDLPYTETAMPNILGHKTQQEATLEAESHSLLLNSQCSPYMKLFLCSLYTPECIEGTARPPCRKLCELARTDCQPMLDKFGLPWPEAFMCSKFTTEACEQISAEDALAKLHAGDFSFKGKSLTLRTVQLLLVLMDVDQSGRLDTLEFFKLQHYVAAVRSEYLGQDMYRSLPLVSQTQVKSALTTHDLAIDNDTFQILWKKYGSESGIDYDDYVALITELRIFNDRFKAHLLNVPCKCQVASFSFKQFMKAAII